MKKISTVEKHILFPMSDTSKNVPPSFQTLNPLLIKTFVEKIIFRVSSLTSNMFLSGLSNTFFYGFGKIKAEKTIKVGIFHLDAGFVRKTAQIKVFEKY